MKNFVLTVIGVTLFILLGVGGLTFIRNINRQPSVLLTSTECAPPCWAGIQPGKTSTFQTYDILDMFSGINKDSIMWETDRNSVLTGIDWFFQPPIEDQGGYIYFKDNKVTAIDILTVNSLKLSELFEKLGEPEAYWTRLGQGDNREYLEMALIHPSKGYVAIVLIDTDSDTSLVEIRDNTPVFTVVYFVPELFDELLKAKILIDHPVDPNTFQKWTGYGSISFERK